MLQADGFSWEDCGNGQDPVVIQSLSVSPDPVSIPGNLSISAAVSSSVAITSPLKVGMGSREGSKLHNPPGAGKCPGMVWEQRSLGTSGAQCPLPARCMGQ